MTVVDAFMSLPTADAVEHFDDQPLLADVARFFGSGGPSRAMGVDDVVAAMTAAGIEQGVLTGSLIGGSWLTRGRSPADPTAEVIEGCERHPDRFRAAFMIDAIPRVDGIRTVCRRIEEVASHPLVALVRVVPLLVEEPIDSRVFYPVYERCEALSLPVSINVGVPGPKVRARYQDALLLDDVLIDFPHLVVIGAHMGHPWEDLLIRLMMKYENLYLSNSAYLAKYIDPRLVAFMNSSRGLGKVLFATDFPLLPFDRALNEARRLALSADAMEAFLGESCKRVLRWDDRAA